MNNSLALPCLARNVENVQHNYIEGGVTKERAKPQLSHYFYYIC